MLRDQPLREKRKARQMILGSRHIKVHLDDFNKIVIRHIDQARPLHEEKHDNDHQIYLKKAHKQYYEEYSLFFDCNQQKGVVVDRVGMLIQKMPKIQLFSALALVILQVQRSSCLNCSPVGLLILFF
ncbi:hypothetical protein RF11_08781 [Thelohanellus kitauei]|uniref:Uncharacterized protein n=1 Tax=Thelohanellus kitauei TaxID=669202 RepID=A0A0C2N4L1_THEKT|nr:hypothetical protein RF11_08781 [Thelohanellus kitauei]